MVIINKPRIAIIGAGLAGLSCALECERHGVYPEMFERGTSVGWNWPSVKYWPDIFVRKKEDIIKYLSDIFDISICYKNKNKGIIVKSSEKQIKVKWWCFYMDIQSLVNAVYARKSRRKYLNRSLKQDHLKKLNKFIDNLQVPFEHGVDITIHKAPKNISYIPLKGPDYFAAFKSNSSLSDQAKTGFVGELFVLYAESLKIATCWYGHFNKRNTYRIVFNTNMENAPQVIHCVTPLGYAGEKMAGISDKITNFIFSRRKKSIEENLHGDSIKDFPICIRKALDLARLAPSAMNCQCWYFKVDFNNCYYLIEISKPRGYRHFKWRYTDIDVGTAASHFWLGLTNQGINCKIQILEEPSRVVWKFATKL